MYYIYIYSSPVIQLFLIFKHPKRFHGITEFFGIMVVYFSGGCKANGRGDAIVFLGLLPTRHGAAKKQGANSSMTAKTQRHYTFKTRLKLWRGNSPFLDVYNEHFRNLKIVTKSVPILLNANVPYSLFSYKYYYSLPYDQEPLRKHWLASRHTFNIVFRLNYSIS